MHSPETVQRFIELRAQGWTYARLMVELNVTKPTFIAWSRKYQFEIQNLYAIELEALREKWLASTTDRVNALGEQFRARSLVRWASHPVPGAEVVHNQGLLRLVAADVRRRIRSPAIPRAVRAS
jgi:hypothetical protein